MIIRHNLPRDNWVKYDKNVFLLTTISDGAKVLYGYMCGLRNGADAFDVDTAVKLGLSQQVLARRKRELKEAGLLLVDQIGPRVYVAYIGHTGISALQVKYQWGSDHSCNSRVGLAEGLSPD